MARKLTGHKFKHQNATYPWDIWLNGEVWELSLDDVPTYGSIESFRVELSRKARMKGLGYQTEINKEQGTVIIQTWEL